MSPVAFDVSKSRRGGGPHFTRLGLFRTLTKRAKQTRGPWFNGYLGPGPGSKVGSLYHSTPGDFHIGLTIVHIIYLLHIVPLSYSALIWTLIPLPSESCTCKLDGLTKRVCVYWRISAASSAIYCFATTLLAVQFQITDNDLILLTENW